MTKAKITKTGISNTNNLIQHSVYKQVSVQKKECLSGYFDVNIKRIKREQLGNVYTIRFLLLAYNQDLLTFKSV